MAHPDVSLRLDQPAELDDDAWRAEVLELLHGIDERVKAFEELLEHYRPALEVVERRANLATKWKGRRDAKG